LTPEELVSHYPRLYHMAAEGTWPLIREHGLLSTRQLVDTCSPTLELRQAVLNRHRPDNITLQHPSGGVVVVRDQAPLRQIFLAKCLHGMTSQEWLDVLNGRVFFWLHPEKLGQLLNARRYRKHAHDVLAVDTASLLDSHAERIRLSAINSGATLYPNAPRRGPDTFQHVADYPFTQYRKSRTLREAVIELAVIDGVSDIDKHTIRVERRRGDEVLEVMFSNDT
jgi:frataxin-like iron-binding protein CyaY